MKQARKISENEILIETIYYKKDGSPITISSDKRQRNQIEKEIQILDNKINHWNTLDISAMVANEQKGKDEALKLKQAVDGDIGDVVVVEED